MHAMLLATILLAATAIAAAATLASAMLRPHARGPALAGAAAVAVLVAAAWIVFGFRATGEVGLAAGGATACLLVVLAALALRPALARARRLDAEVGRAEELFSR